MNINSVLQNKNNYIFDLDGTICDIKPSDIGVEGYSNVKPKKEIVKLIKKLKENGKTITILTARHMKTMNGDVDMVMDAVGDITEKWLSDNDIPYDMLWYGKPYGMVQVDDRSITPAELISLERDGKLDEIDDYFNEKDLTIKLNNIISLVKNHYYVYQWYYIDSNNSKHIFYVGKGKKMRAFDTNRNEEFNKIYREKNCDVEIVKLFDTNKEALAYERKLKYANKDIGFCESSLDDERGRIVTKPSKPKKVEKEKKIDRRTLPKSPETISKISETKKRNGSSKGLRNSMAKLDEETIKLICMDFNKGLRSKDIVDNYDISGSQIRRLYAGTAHRDITDKYLEDGYGYKK